MVKDSPRRSSGAEQGDTSPLLYEKRNQIAYITLNRPQVHNAINLAMSEALGKALEDFRDDPSVVVGIMTGAGGRAFSAGADLKEMSALGQAAGTRFLRSPVPLQVWKPLIAAIDGYALAGGLHLALECDIRIATEQSKLGLLVTRVGTIEEGTSMPLSKMVPIGEALHLTLTGGQISASEALRIGLVHKVLASRQALMAEAEAIAEEIKLCAPLATQAAKQLLYMAMDHSQQEVEAFARSARTKLARTQDAIEGPRAFAEKRKPVWKGA